MLYLINYRNTNSCKCKSITELPFLEAKAVADHLYQNSPCTAHRRFGPDFAQYYNDRQKAEQWLHDHFINSGGNPQSKHPLYFVVQYTEEPVFDFGNYQTFRLNLNDIADEDVSFSLGDSMHLYYQGVLNHLLTKNDLLELLRTHEPDMHNFLSKTGLIEAHLWNHSYCR